MSIFKQRFHRTALALYLLVAAAIPGHAQTPREFRAATPAEQMADAAAFDGIDALLAEKLTDVQSAVVVMRARVVYQYYRDGKPDALRDVQSLNKSALATLVGAAISQGRIASLDQSVVALMPEWATANADPRASAITLRHLLTMTAGFRIDDPIGDKPPLRARDGWSRPIDSAPGQTFAYDNSVVPIVVAVLEKVTRMPMRDYARQQLVAPLGMQEPAYERGLMQLRTVDAARLGQLYLQKGMWDGKQLVAESFVMEATKPQVAGGPPLSMPYGFMWWLPSRQTFMASGYGGQFVWVHPPLDLVVAITSPVTQSSHQRGQALQLIRGPLFAAAQKRAATSGY